MSRRHVLIIATQCASEAPLTELKSSAVALQQAFLDSDAGACRGGLADETALRCGDLTAQQVTDAIREGARHAADHEAVLVLALLGHGFVPGNSTRLYYMAHDSVNQDRESAVDISGLLVNVVDNVRIEGLIAIVDTCMAAAGVPDVRELVAGAARGQSRIAMILAAGAGQKAYSLRVSQSLAKVLRDGLPGAGPRLDVANVTPALKFLVPAQTVTKFEFDGGPANADGLWLGHNRLHAPGGATLLGRHGRAHLDEALAALGLPPLPPEVDLSSLAEAGRSLAGGEDPHRVYARRAVATIALTMKTAVFVRTTMERTVSSAALERAMSRLDAVGAPRSVTAERFERATEVDFLEHVALRRTGVSWPAARSLAYFIVALADAVGIEVDDGEIADWARSVGASVYLNDAATAVRSLAATERLRLVVSLHASLTGDHWPERLEVWLLDRAADHGRLQLPCTPSQPGVEAALAEAIEWAEEEAYRRGAELAHIDVAVPSGLLLRWRPEETVYGKPIGLEYHVMVHWDRRLVPGRGQAWILTGVRRRVSGTLPPGQLDWLTDDVTGNAAELDQRLRNGRYPYAVGLSHSPSTSDVLDLLLSHVPILLWPGSADIPVGTKDRVRDCWHLMPTALREAYRQRRTSDDPDPLADLRSVWEDLDWLAFCATYTSSIRSR